MTMAETGEVAWTTPTGERLITYLSDLRPPSTDATRSMPPAGHGPQQPDDPPF
jgi:hypothetical protein